MKETRNECVNCGKPCLVSCPYKNVTRFYCDECGAEEQLYYYEGQELCIDCIKNQLDKVEV